MSILAVEALYDCDPEISPEDLLAAVRGISPNVVSGELAEGNLCTFFHRDYAVSYPERLSAPAQTHVFLADIQQKTGRYQSALEQCYDFEGAQAAVDQARCGLLVTDLLASSMAPLDRIEIVARTLVALTQVSSPIAFHWKASDRLTDPERIQTGRMEAARDPSLGALNVRMFRIERHAGDSEEIVMDSLGMAPFGLPDVQCHFVGLPAGRVAGYLLNIACYLLEKGDVIQSGHTVQGLDESQIWKAQHEDSMVAPERVVVDLCPHAPHAAGNR